MKNIGILLFIPIIFLFSYIFIIYIINIYFSNKNIERFSENNTKENDKENDNKDKTSNFRDPSLNRKYNIEHDKELNKYKKMIGEENIDDDNDDDYKHRHHHNNNHDENNEENIHHSTGKNKIVNTKLITDNISDKYLPYTNDIFDNNKNSTPEDINNEYTIINLYKTLLDRQPDKDELRKNLNLFNTKELNDETLKIQILNSPEYNHNNKMQSNEIEPGLIGAIAKEDLLSKLSILYNRERNIIVPKKMLLPLRDCYIHLQYNDYLYRAMLVNENYSNFEKDVLDTPMLSQENLLKLFDKYFLLSDLKSTGNDIRKKQLLEMKNQLGTIPEPVVNKGHDINNKDTNIKEQLNKIVNQSDKVFNKDDVAKVLKNGNYSSDLFIRLYEPTKYKQQYRGDPLFRPPVCTTLGQKQLVQPIFENSKTLFQGTDIREATENTQVGSIMPKFEYKEYIDINVV